MGRYAIGDVQGCYDSLQNLLEVIRFDPRQDCLWLVGDLVNRGPKSLQVLRWAKSMGDSVVAVLGNHDLHLLATAAGHRARASDTLQEVLDAPDADELIHWLRHRPLLYREDRWVMVHAGVHPRWSVKKATRLAREVEDRLQSKTWHKLFSTPLAEASDWSKALEGNQRRRSIARVLAGVRMVHEDGSLCADFAGPPESAPDGCIPWFSARDRGWKDYRFVFGHWAALGLRTDAHYVSLDSGCVWGRKLTAVRLRNGRAYQVDAAE